MSSSVQEPRGAVAPAKAGFEQVACPKCGSDRGAVVATGRDYLYGVAGTFSVWECAGCGLQYQNPRPTADRLADLYPSGYGPHGGGGAKAPLALETPSLKGRLKRSWPLSAVWPLLHATRAQVRSLRVRLGRFFAESFFFHPVRANRSEFLRERLGYHLPPALSRHPWHVLRFLFRPGCRRHAGVEMIPSFVPDGRLLEIGCATGDRLQTLRDLGWQNLDGIELVESAAAQARARGFPVLCEPVETALARYPDGHFDAIITSMVLEHLQDPFGVVRQIARKLKPGGEFLFSTVTRDAPDAKLFGPYWAGYDFPRHMVYLRKSDIRDMLADDFGDVCWFHQNAPIDFVRSASWRRAGGGWFDRLVMAWAKSPLGPLCCALFARLGWTTRVSLRCRKKSS